MKSKLLSLSILLALMVSAAPAAPTADHGRCVLDPPAARAMIEALAPVLVQPAKIPAEPERMFYRYTFSDDGRDLIVAYHPAWPYEEDPSPGWWPALMRAVYTGGLKLQRVIYGPGDIEVIEMTVDLETKRVKRLRFETADFDAKGMVIHVEVVKQGDEVPAYTPLAFEVVSWNHLFGLLDQPPAQDAPVYRLPHEPFTGEMWKYYRMSKKLQTGLSLDRDQWPWETASPCPFPAEP